MEPSPPDGGDADAEPELPTPNWAVLEEDIELAPLVLEGLGDPKHTRPVRRPWWQFPILPLLILAGWLSRLSDAFGSNFVFAVMIVYGISQGIGETVGGFSSNYFWKDVMRVSPAESQLYNALPDIPWDIKPLWGLLTDSFPIAGSHTRSWIALSSLLGVFCWGTVAATRLPKGLAATALVGTNVAMALPDVVTDAAVAMRSRAKPQLAADLQSLTWGTLAVGSLIGMAFSGPAVHYLGSRGTFALLAAAPALTLLAAWALPEPKAAPNQKGGFARVWHSLRLFVGAMRDPRLWQSALYIYLSQALCPDIGEAKFYWLTDKTGTGPGFSENFLGFLATVGNLAMLAGVLAYQWCLKDQPFRRVFLWAQVTLVLTGLLDLILVTRVNQRLGIPDHAFVVGDEAVQDAIDNLRMVPMQVLAARLCPPGIEGTLFAFLMSLSNAGANTAELLGAGLIKSLGVTSTDFSNLWLALTIRSLMKLLPIAFLFLVPDATPTSDFGDAVPGKSMRESHSGVDLVVRSVITEEHGGTGRKHHAGMHSSDEGF